MLGARSGLDASEEAVKKAAKEAGRSPPKVLKIELDVTNPASVAQAAAEVETSAGRLDVLVNNAGLIDMTMIKDSDPETWWRVWEVNVKGPYLIARAFLPLMLKNEDSLKQVVTTARYVVTWADLYHHTANIAPVSAPTSQHLPYQHTSHPNWQFCASRNLSTASMARRASRPSRSTPATSSLKWQPAVRFQTNSCTFSPRPQSYLQTPLSGLLR